MVVVVVVNSMKVLELFVEDIGIFEVNLLLPSVGIILHLNGFGPIDSVCSYIFRYLHRKHIKGYTVKFSRKGITLAISLFLGAV